MTHANHAPVDGKINTKLPQGMRTSRRSGRYGR